MIRGSNPGPGRFRFTDVFLLDWVMAVIFHLRGSPAYAVRPIATQTPFLALSHG